MKVFLDTSVIVAAVVEKHESHARALAVLDRIQNGTDDGHVSAHSMAEVYAVLTKAPPPMRHTPEQALLSIEENIIKYFNIMWLTGADYADVIREATLAGILGGTIYDAVLLRCAVKAAARKIYTLNLNHFQNVAPRNLGSQIVAP